MYSDRNARTNQSRRHDDTEAFLADLQETLGMPPLPESGDQEFDELVDYLVDVEIGEVRVPSPPPPLPAHDPFNGEFWLTEERSIASAADMGRAPRHGSNAVSAVLGAGAAAVFAVVGFHYAAHRPNAEVVRHDAPAATGRVVSSDPPKTAAQPRSIVTTAANPGAAKAMFDAVATFYYPADDPLQGGFNDRKGAPLHTVHDFIDDRKRGSRSVPHISVAIDIKGDMQERFPYGTRIAIPTLEEFYRKQYNLPADFEFVWKLVDTGSAFFHKGTSRLDICTKNREKAYEEGGTRPIKWHVWQ